MSKTKEELAEDYWYFFDDCNRHSDGPLATEKKAVKISYKAGMDFQSELDKRNDLSESPNKAQIVRCKCGSIVAAGRLPESYGDSDWMRNIKKFYKKGYSIEIVDIDGSWNLDLCKCQSIKKDNEPDLFDKQCRK